VGGRVKRQVFKPVSKLEIIEFFVKNSKTMNSNANLLSEIDADVQTLHSEKRIPYNPESGWMKAVEKILPQPQKRTRVTKKEKKTVKRK